MIARLSALALGLADCDLFSMKWESDVTFTTDHDDVRVGDTVEVRFSIRKEDGRHWWIALVPEERSFTDTEGRIALAKGQKTVRLEATEECRCEVRVFHDPDGQAVMVARGKVRVRP